MRSPHLSTLKRLAGKRRRVEQDIPLVAGLAREDGATLQEIADALGVTKQRVSQILKR